MTRILPLFFLFGFLWNPLLGQKKTSMPKGFTKMSNGKLYFSKTEVSINEYYQFLKGLIDLGRADEVSLHAPASAVWLKEEGDTEALYQTYFAHFGFSDYPVVGISYESAQAYCDWKTEMAAESVYENGKYTKKYHFKYKLPNRDEWMEAAYCGNKDAIYPGGFKGPKNSKEIFQFNFRPSEKDYITDNFEFTAPVFSFSRSSCPILNIAGNVSEMTSQEGVSLGGSWVDGPEELKIGKEKLYDSPEAWLGFRVVIEEIGDN